MQWQSNPYFIPLIIAGLISLINALVVAQRHRVTGSLPLLGMLLAVSFWSFTYAFELASASLEWEVMWARAEYIGIIAVPAFLLLFALDYAGLRRSIPRSAATLLWVIPLACLALVWTNDLHGLIWSEISQKDGGGFYLLSLEHGPAFWIWVGYSYLLLLGGSFVMIRKAVTSPPEFRPQSFIIIFGVLATWAGNIIYLSGFSPVPDLDITPIFSILSMIAYSIGIFRFGILDIMPIAGETVLESLDTVVIVLDDAGRIAYVNKAFEYYTGKDVRNYFGKTASEALPIWTTLSRLVDPQGPARGEVVLHMEGRDPVFFNARASTVRWQNQRLGRVFILEDISERRRAETSAFSQSDESLIHGARIPVIFAIRAQDEKIIEVNRSFILEMGYGRKEVVGQSPLQLGMWDAYQRGDFLKILRSEGQVKDQLLYLVDINRKRKAYLASAHRMDIQEESYFVILAKPGQG